MAKFRSPLGHEAQKIADWMSELRHYTVYIDRDEEGVGLWFKRFQLSPSKSKFVVVREDGTWEIRDSKYFKEKPVDSGKGLESLKKTAVVNKEECRGCSGALDQFMDATGKLEEASSFDIDSYGDWELYREEDAPGSDEAAAKLSKAVEEATKLIDREFSQGKTLAQAFKLARGHVAKMQKSLDEFGAMDTATDEQVFAAIYDYVASRIGDMPRDRRDE